MILLQLLVMQLPTHKSYQTYYERKMHILEFLTVNPSSEQIYLMDTTDLCFSVAIFVRL